MTASTQTAADVSAEIERIFALQQAHQWDVKASTAEQRKAKLAKLRDAVQAHADDIVAAVLEDTRKPEGEIRVVCTKMGGRFTMMVSDDGIGFNAEKTMEQPVSLGLTLITALVEQVNGTLKAVNKAGTTYYISFEE